MPFHKKILNKIKDFIDDAVDFVTDTVKAVVDIVASPFAMPDMGGDGTSGQVNQQILGPLVNKDSGVGNIPVVYGERRLGGYRVFISTNGTDNEYLYVALAICEGQVQGIDKIYIDEDEVPMSSYAHGTQATPSSGAYSDRLVTQFFDGRDDQTVSTLLDVAPGWGSNHRMRGVSYLACRFRWKKIEDQADSDNNPYRSGIPKIQVRLKGRKIFNIINGYTQAYKGAFTNATLSGGGAVAHTTNVANGSRATLLPTENTVGDAYFTTSTSDATISVRATSTVRSRDNQPGEYQSVALQAILYNSNGGATVSSTATSRVTTTDSTPATAVVDHVFAVPTGTYQIQLMNVITGNGPQTGLANGSFQFSTELPIDGAATHATTYANETEEYNNNPVNVLLDYLRNTTYGKGLANDYFDWDSIKLAAQQCEQTVPYTSSTTGKFSVFDGYIETSESLLNNVKTILASFNGIMPYQSGKYFVKLHHGGNLADVDSAPNPPPVTMIINEDNLIGGLRIAGESKQRKVNQLRVTYTDPDADYQPNDVFWPPSDGSVYSTYLTEDNGIPLDKQITLPHCTNRERALNMAETLVKTSRNKMAIQFSTTTAVTDVSVGDLVNIQNRNLNFDGYFRVESMNLSPSGTLGFTASEHNSNDYVLDGQAAAASKPTINLPDPLLVSAPASVTVTSSGISSTSGYVAQSQMRVTWTASTDPFTTDYIIQYKLSSDSTYITAGQTNDTTFFIGPVSTGEQYDVRVTARNELDRRSDYASAATHTVS